MTRDWRGWGRCTTLLLLAFSLALAACSNDSTAIVPVPDEASSTTAAETTTSAPAVEQVDADLAALEQRWAAVWAAAGQTADNRTDALAPFTDTLGTQAAELLNSGFRGAEERTITNYPSFVENEDGSITINDCLLLSVVDTAGASKWYEGRAVPNDDGWLIETITPIELEGCVPDVLAEEVLAAYEESVTAIDRYWNPAQPDHPSVEATMTGARLERIREVLTDHQRDGWSRIEEIETHAEIFAVFNTTFVKVLDCQTSAPGRGLFDADGNRQEGIGEVTDPDQRNIKEVTMLLVDGVWKVSDVQGQDDWDCEFPPSERGLPRV